MLFNLFPDQTEVQPDVPIDIDNNSQNTTVDESKEESGNNLESMNEILISQFKKYIVINEI